MTYTLTDLNSWPLRRDDEPIFKSTNDAYLYAQLIYKLQYKQDRLVYFRKLTYRLLKDERERKDPDLDRMMDLAVRAQFYRECLEEVQRIKGEKLNTPRV